VSKKKNKSALDFLVNDEMKIPTKDGGYVVARQFNPKILMDFIGIVLSKTHYNDLNKRDKDDIKIAVNLIFPEYDKYTA
tara:strand:+ start:913 stop:1149 length:237 start_codon:yes stop_codon:yes gene_type:complete